MVRSIQPSPLAHAIKASELRAGMTTYTRIVDVDGNVAFRVDLILKERIIDTGACNGVHFVANSSKGKGDMRVCYFYGAEVWVKDAES